MEEQTPESLLETHGDLNKNASSLQPQRVDVNSLENNMPPIDDDEDYGDMPDLLWPEKPSLAVETNSRTYTASSSSDTGFESACNSKKSSPVEISAAEESFIEGAISNKGEERGENAASNDEVKEAEMDILGNGLLKKKILVSGKGVRSRPQSGDIVTVKVDGQLPDGTHVDTGEITFHLNDGDVILAFDLAVSLMEDGEKCELYTSEKYAYGSLGREPDIPKNTSIAYVLELVDIQKPPEVGSLTYEQRLKMGEAKRERGNYLFGRADYSGAINSYNKAVKLLDHSDPREEIDESCLAFLTESWVKCYNSLAACQLKIDVLDAAIRSCEKVLSVQEDNVKALFRLGKAYGAKNEIDLALTHLRQAVKLDPESKIIHQELLNFTRRKNKETETEKALYQRMLAVKPEKTANVAEKAKKKSSNRVIKWTLAAGRIVAVISFGLNWYRTL